MKGCDMAQDGQDEVVSLSLSDDLYRTVDATAVMDGCTVTLRGRTFTLREVMAGLMGDGGDQVVDLIDSMRADRLVTGHDWFRTSDERSDRSD